MAGAPRARGSLEARATRDRFARSILLPAQSFIHTEGIGSAVLLAAAVGALVLANSPAAEGVRHLWDVKLTLDLAVVRVSEDIHHWVNDGLMALFFFVVGLEIKREVMFGALTDRKKAALPAAAALGGMVVPALLFGALNFGGEGARGWGIPMATDIAFALGALGLLGKRIPSELRVFLLALAVVDDLGAILVIALFYTGTVSVPALGSAAVILAVILLARAAGVRSPGAFGVLGFLFWVAILESGVHATLAGVILGLLVPAQHRYDDATALALGRRLTARLRGAVARSDHDDIEATLGALEEVVVGTESPLERLERKMHPWTAFVVLPLFAFVNAGIPLSAERVTAALESPVVGGIVLGLVMGKVVGVAGGAWLAVRSRLASLPEGVRWGQVGGVGLLAGVGFTVSLFVNELAFSDPVLVGHAKVGILLSSLLAGALGMLVLRMTTTPVPAGSDDLGTEASPPPPPPSPR
ncbi:MAG: Na+/H+ antiporter NhaA [Gemmatimonadetes bacterium]|nr:Na+/H+ antiporter NhaA [Gemmatimonadota bacterium]